ncbi:hypothetical protein ACQY0O_003476 [Thecaphora frezii]
MRSFLQLPIDLHENLGDFLEHDDLCQLSKTSRGVRALYRPVLETYLQLDGSLELLGFLAHHLPTNKGSRTGHVSLSGSARNGASERLGRIRHIILYEPGVVWRGAQQEEVERLFAQIDPNAVSEAAGGPIGAVLALCPNAKTLMVLQTPLALMPSLASVMVAKTPRLRSLTYRSPHVDAEAVATAVAGLRYLHTLDVSGVRTCRCRGEAARRNGVRALAASLRQSGSLRRLVFTACRALSTDRGALLSLIASDDDGFGVTRGERTILRLSSLELRRSPVKGPALAALLRSQACRELQHIFVGGCKRIRGRHFGPPQQSNGCSTDGGDRAASALAVNELSIDGRLLSTDLNVTALKHLRRLRIYAPRPHELRILLRIVEEGNMPLLSELILLPCDGDVDGWLAKEACPEADSIRSMLAEGLRRYCQQHATIRVGDSLWWRVRTEKGEMVEGRGRVDDPLWD